MTSNPYSQAHLEVSLENEFCQELADTGWEYDLKGSGKGTDNSGYDKDLALFSGDLIKWLKDTNQWQDDFRIEALSKQVSSQIKDNGIRQTLLSGVSYRGQELKLLQNKPLTELNRKLAEDYKSNIFRIARQLYYSNNNGNSVDVVLFLNGLPLFTIELKSNGTQTVEDAIEQYRMDRLPEGEPLLQNALAYFAISTDEIYVTTELQGKDTKFSHFNKASNPAQTDARYFWEVLLKKSEILNLIENFFQDSYFPRFHQWEALKNVISDIKSRGPGNRYLFEHSPGGGKTATMTSLAYQLATLHDENSKAIFDGGVIIVTDRIVLDRQASKSLESNINKQDMVGFIDGRGISKSKELIESIQSGRKINIVTLHTFQFMDQDPAFTKFVKNKKIAIIIDEAHSSQSGQMSNAMRDSLSGEADSFNEANLPDKISSLNRPSLPDKSISTTDESDSADNMDPEKPISAEDFFNQKVRQAKSGSNLTYFAFTATPKQETLEIFGQDSKAFHTFSLIEAENEGFVMKVLDQVIFFDNEVVLTINGQQYTGLEIEKNKGKRKIINWIDDQPEVLENKIRESYNIASKLVQTQIKEKGKAVGKGKAMYVCRSREQAARASLIFNELSEANSWGVSSLAAFSGEVEVDGVIYSESSINFGERDVASALKKDKYLFMFVADKYQLGYSESLLTGLFIDKTLTEPSNIVQTYSRVNRICPGKTSTIIVDFVNQSEDIFAAFDIYRKGTNLSRSINDLESVEKDILELNLYNNSDLKQFVDLLKETPNGGTVSPTKLDRIMNPIVQDYFDQIQKSRITGDLKLETKLISLPKALKLFDQVYQIQERLAENSITITLAQKHEFYKLLRIKITPRLNRLNGEEDTVIIEGKLKVEEHRLVSSGEIENEGNQNDDSDISDEKRSKKERNDPVVMLKELIDEINSKLMPPDPTLANCVTSLVEAVSSDETIQLQASTNAVQSFNQSKEFNSCFSTEALDLQLSSETFNSYVQAGWDDVQEQVKQIIYLRAKNKYLDSHPVNESIELN